MLCCAHHDGDNKADADPQLLQNWRISRLFSPLSLCPSLWVRLRWIILSTLKLNSSLLLRLLPHCVCNSDSDSDSDSLLMQSASGGHLSTQFAAKFAKRICKWFSFLPLSLLLFCKYVTKSDFNARGGTWPREIITTQIWICTEIIMCIYIGIRVDRIIYIVPVSVAKCNLSTVGLKLSAA